tara:strand:+ start:4178 stop:5356 length:1179 start_codon:yes stop_codon:yes gene_type:complete
MLFQVIQNHLFADGDLKLYQPSEKLTHTWSYSKILKDINPECAKIWAEGKGLDSCCPYSLEAEWKKNKNKIKAFLKSFKKVGLDTSNIDYVDFIPEKFIKRYLQNINQISGHVFSSCERPENYDFMFDLICMIEDIKSQNLKINRDFLKSRVSNIYMRNLWKKLQKIEPRIAYNPYGTVTGRLSIQSGSFPILNIAREARGAILPHNDCFVELDFNAAELRTLLALCGNEQPEEDIHDFNNQELFGGSLTREEIKKKTFSWLYDQKKVDKDFEKMYNRSYVLREFWNEEDEMVVTPFGRRIKADREHALNYIVQSTSSDNFLKQAIKIWKMLKGRKTNVAFTVHDSLVLDFDLCDKEIIQVIMKEFSNTELGKFKVNISGGRSFGSLKEMKL